MAGNRQHAIRRAQPEDLHDIQRCVDAAYRQYVPRMGRKPGPMLDDYAQRIANDQVFVFEDSGRVKGMLVMICCDERCLLDNVAVFPQHTGKGIGGRLLEYAEHYAANRQYRRLELYTHATMVENIAMYERRGYTQTRRVTEHGFERVYMCKALA